MLSIKERIQQAFDRARNGPEPEIRVEVVSQPTISLNPFRAPVTYSGKNVYEIVTPDVPCVNTLYNEALKSLGL